ncbi:MAG: glycosyltransferase family protein, partial [Bacteroidota bacterium]
MRILYAIQGTGNGHLSRARDIVPHLRRMCETDILVSGTESQVDLGFDIKYQCKGFSFSLNHRGGINVLKSASRNLSPRLLREIVQLPVEDYDLVINDFEPVSAWAARLRGIPSVSLGHQASFQSDQTPRPEKKDPFGEFVLKSYAPCRNWLGFHFDRYDDNIYTPVIRRGIRNLSPENHGHITVYLSAISDKRLLPVLQQIPEVQWQVFSRLCKKTYRAANVWVEPVDNDRFIQSLTNCMGILCGAGFETPAEALYLGKKLCVLPIRGQYEQNCNAAALRKMGVSVLQRLKVESLKKWIHESTVVPVYFPDQTEMILERLLSYHIYRR